MSKPQEQNYFDLTRKQWEEWCLAFKSKAELGVLVWIKIKDPENNKRFEYKEIAEALGLHVSTVSRALRNVVAKGYLSSRYLASEANTIERQIRDQLHSQLGGLAEVATPAGRIDLLTNDEIIEVKHVSEWKSAMGQVLAYSGFYPEHSKRIHLFGKKGELPTSTAITICSELGIVVTFEEVTCEPS